eukprot:TRINITY_DN41841_c0_g1_i1.p1 TRINITY_DN41841_c0_g1~~TRINITY_DN41841_c0_g1_i1.p1  ORF type:complete len:836 (-),score=174.65 TRINITY_DN41841_c0_g1_i1:13-2520(-)
MSPWPATAEAPSQAHGGVSARLAGRRIRLRRGASRAGLHAIVIAVAAVAVLIGFRSRAHSDGRAHVAALHDTAAHLRERQVLHNQTVLREDAEQDVGMASGGRDEEEDTHDASPTSKPSSDAIVSTGRNQGPPGVLLNVAIWRLERRRRRLRQLQNQVATTRGRVSTLAKLQKDDSLVGKGDQELKALSREAVRLGEQMRSVGDDLQRLRAVKKFRVADKEAKKARERLDYLRLSPGERIARTAVKVARTATSVATVVVPSITLLRATHRRLHGNDSTGWKFPLMASRKKKHRSEGQVVQLVEGNGAENGKGKGKGARPALTLAKRIEELFWMWIARRVLQGNLWPKSVGFLRPQVPDVSLEDVVGLGAAKQEAAEVVDFLRAPARYDALGAKCPRGILLTGPPGCGKTMLSKAIAAAAGAPFIEISGADFNQRYAGVGTSLVKDIFARARQMAPAVVFIDEIDYIGRRRSEQGGSVETDRTAALTQLLTELDGFQGRDGVVVVGTTNRPDLLDSALLRPGRFDRRLTLPLPDLAGREKILQSHGGKIIMAEAVNWTNWARRTSGMSGADLAGLLNEAAVTAARENKVVGVAEEHLQKAYSKMLLGLPSEKRPSKRKQTLTAYHEAGHAVVNEAMRASFPEEFRDGFPTVEHVSIVAQGDSGGNTQFASPQEGLELPHGRKYLLAILARTLGGRAAEEISEGADGVTMGASADIESATSLAETMVRQGGLGFSVGPRLVDDNYGKKHSESLLKAADEEVQKILDAAQAAALDALEQNRGLFEAVAAALVDEESLNGTAFKALVEAHSLTPGRPLLAMSGAAQPAADIGWFGWLRR